MVILVIIDWSCWRNMLVASIFLTYSSIKISIVSYDMYEKLVSNLGVLPIYVVEYCYSVSSHSYRYILIKFCFIFCLQIYTISKGVPSSLTASWWSDFRNKWVYISCMISFFLFTYMISAVVVSKFKYKLWHLADVGRCNCLEP